MGMDLFEPETAGKASDAVKPLAEGMRTASFEDLAGSPDLFGPGAPLRRGVEEDSMGSAILWGPPGCGKTSVAHLLRKTTKIPFRTLSAVQSGVAELRGVLDEGAKRVRAGLGPVRLFIDEIHRYNKAQQDALLPAVESGSVRLLGATTENPSYSLNPALVSRCQVFRLEPISGDALLPLLRKALTDPVHGMGRRDLAPAEDALAALADAADGDLRAALNLLEWTLASLGPDEPLSPQSVARAAGRRPPAYDRTGDGRYQMISALHKSVRGSDPQAALYWLARMVDAGEDPVYIARRMIRMASEDVGLADPQALVQALAARDACEHLGLPECSLALAQAALYLSLCPKSNGLETAWHAAQAAIARHGQLPVPMEFQNAVTAFDRKRAVGEGYRYDHDSPDAYSGQDHLPAALRGASFWNPVERGFERELRKRLDWFQSRREGNGKSPARSDPDGA
jgi:putative ATPase